MRYFGICDGPFRQMEALGFALALWHVLPIKLELRDWGT